MQIRWPAKSNGQLKICKSLSYAKPCTPYNCPNDCMLMHADFLPGILANWCAFLLCIISHVWLTSWCTANFSCKLILVFALHDAMHVCSQVDCWFMHFANVAYLSACSCMLACCKKQVLYAQHNLTYLPTTIMHEKQCWLTLLILSPTQNTSNMVELVKHDQCIPPPAGGQNI